MPDIYLRSTTGSDANNGSTWALAKATLASALTAAGDGGRVFVSKVHSESGVTTVHLTTTDTTAVRVLCVDDTGNPEPPTALATGAIVSTDLSGTPVLTFQTNDPSNIYSYGVTYRTQYRINLGSQTSGRGFLLFDNCSLVINGGSSDGYIRVSNGAGGTRSVFRNCTFQFGQASQDIRTNTSPLTSGDALFIAPALAGTTPTTPFSPGHGSFEVRGADLSAVSGNLCAAPVQHGRALFVNCKLHSSVTPVTGTFQPSSSSVELINCDSSTNYRFYRGNFWGTEQQDTAIYRTGGSTDGTTPYSRKIVSTANTGGLVPYRSLPLEIWNETTGSSITVAVSTVTDNITLKDNEAWIEASYLGTAGTPLATLVSDSASDVVFGAGANQSDDSASTWVTTGLGTPVKQKLHVSFTPQVKGLIRARVMLAKASTTMYYDPKLQLSAGGDSARQYQSTQGVVNEGAAGGGASLRGILTGGRL